MNSTINTLTEFLTSLGPKEHSFIVSGIVKKIHLFWMKIHRFLQKFLFVLWWRRECVGLPHQAFVFNLDLSDKEM